MSETRNGDDSRDAHLLAALRHAPDRDALPPHEVSARILAAARAAVRPAPWWTRVGAWLTQPQVAAAFGTLAVASLVGIMWSTREPPVVEPEFSQAMRERSVPSAVAEQPSSPAAVTAGAAAPPEPERDLLAKTAPSTPAPKQEAAPHRAQEAKVRAESRRRADVLADKAAVPAAKTEAPSAEAAAAAPQAADAPPAAPAAEQRVNATTVSPPLARRDAASSGSASTAAPAAGALSLAPRANIAPNPLAQADVSLAAERGSWSSSGRVLPHAAAQAAWWAQFQRATAAAWSRVPPAAERTSPPWLMLMEGGKGIASIDLAADSVVFCAADQTACWRAPITAAQREAWIAEVARW
jgi:hypothetical protein